MRRREKIYAIKGLLSGRLVPEEIKPEEVEVWFQEGDSDHYRHFKTGELLGSKELAKREGTNYRKKYILLTFVNGRTIL